MAKNNKSSNSKLLKKLEKVEKSFNADVYLFCGDIDADNSKKILGDILVTKFEKPKQRNALLILVTNGGSAHDGYQIASAFQEFYKELILYAPFQCISAGTLIALGANKLILDSLSELGTNRSSITYG